MSRAILALAMAGALGCMSCGPQPTCSDFSGNYSATADPPCAGSMPCTWAQSGCSFTLSCGPTTCTGTVSGSSFWCTGVATGGQTATATGSFSGNVASFSQQAAGVTCTGTLTRL